MKNELGFSATAIQKMLSNEKWVEIYQSELKTRSESLNAKAFEKGMFNTFLKEKLQKSLASEISKDEHYIRNGIAKWMQISHLKAFSMFCVMPFVQAQLKKTLEIYTRYHDVPLGPQDGKLVKKMDEEMLEKWRDGNMMIFYGEASINNVLGLYVSEVFFTTEAMLRIICMGSCIEFGIKTILPNQIIQHDEIYKTLKKLSNDDYGKVNCRLCSMNDKCPRRLEFGHLAAVYEVLYHLRAIKDYKREFYFNDSLTDFLIKDFTPVGLNIVFVLDEIINNVYSDFLMFPYTLKDTYKSVRKNSESVKGKK
jgi:hypothetical protein